MGEKKKLAARNRARVVDAAEERLAFEPVKENRNRKQMEENSLEAGFGASSRRTARTMT